MLATYAGPATRPPTRPLALVGRMAWMETPATLTVWGMVSTTVKPFSPPVTLVRVGARGLPVRNLDNRERGLARMRQEGRQAGSTPSR